jgi:hypothetical protein
LEDPLVGFFAFDVCEARSEDYGSPEVVNACHVDLEESILVLSLLGNVDEHDFSVKAIGLQHLEGLDKDHHRSSSVKCDLGLRILFFDLV